MSMKSIDWLMSYKCSFKHHKCFMRENLTSKPFILSFSRKLWIGCSLMLRLQKILFLNNLQKIAVAWSNRKWKLFTPLFKRPIMNKKNETISPETSSHLRLRCKFWCGDAINNIQFSCFFFKLWWAIFKPEACSLSVQCQKMPAHYYL